MALGTPTLARVITTAPLFIDRLTFAGDGAYPAGGTVGFSTYLKTALETAGAPSGGREVIGIDQVDASGYVLRYDKTNDKLMVFEGNYDAADGPLQQTATANLSGQTFSVMVTSK